MNEKKIPNLNTISTFIDRWIIEHVKLSIFDERIQNLENIQEIKKLLDQGLMKEANIFIEKIKCESENMLPKIATQKEIIDALKLEFEEVLHQVFTKKVYRYIAEERTFKI